MLQINASIVNHNSKIWCAFRTEHLFRFDANSFLVELNESLEPVSGKKLIAENNNTAFEDVRLFSTGNVLLAFYTYLPRTIKGSWRWQFAVGFGEVDQETAFIKNQISLRQFGTRTHEKNWSPYRFGDEIFMVTDYDPFLRIIKLGDIYGNYKIEEIFMSSQITIGWKYGELRGGTPLLQRPDTNDPNFYGFAHSFLENEKGFRRYYHYTAIKFNHEAKAFEYHPQPLPYKEEIYTDEDKEEYELLWKSSNNKYFKVIFPIGIMHHKDGIMVSFGKDDVASFIQYFTWDYIVSLFI